MNIGQLLAWLNAYTTSPNDSRTITLTGSGPLGSVGPDEDGNLVFSPAHQG
jgi:hypothetical protein